MYQQMIYQMLENLQEQPGNEPKLNRLGTKEWEKTKSKVKSNLQKNLLNYMQKEKNLKDLSFQKTEKIKKSLNMNLYMQKQMIN